MADYIPILDTQIEPLAPVTSELMFQLRDNPIAITEGASGAPRVVSRGLNMKAMVGSGTFNESTIASIDLGTPGFDVIFCQSNGEFGSTGLGVSNIILRGSNNGSTWVDLAVVASSVNANATSPANGAVVYNGNGGTAYRYYSLVDAGEGDKFFTGYASAIFIGGET